MIIRCYPCGMISANSYLVVDENTGKGFILDPGGYSSIIADSIKENSYEIEYLILTHGHGDHIGGVPGYLKEFPNIKIIADSAEATLLADESLNYSAEICGYPIELDADIYVNDGDTMKIGEMNLEFIHTPGHTKGGMCILIGDCLFSGDTLFRQSIGRTDFAGGSYKEISDSIKNKLFILPDETKVYPGHMEETTIGFEKRNNPFVG